MDIADSFSSRLAETLARAYAQRTELALTEYGRTGATVDLDESLNHARAAVAALIEARGYAPCDVAGARALTAELPALARLAEVCARHAEAAMSRGVGGLWARLGLSVTPPVWSAEDRRLAEGLLALALVSAPEAAERLMGTGLRRIAARRLGHALVKAFAGCPERSFALALGSEERHRGLARRYGKLASLTGREDVRAELLRSLTGWFADGAVRSELPDALEAAFVHALQPAHRV